MYACAYVFGRETGKEGRNGERYNRKTTHTTTTTHTLLLVHMMDGWSCVEVKVQVLEQSAPRHLLRISLCYHRGTNKYAR